MNMFDKGYRLSIEVGQLEKVCLQPQFAKSDALFSRNKLLSSGAVAYLISGNERSVKRMKMSRILKEGIPSSSFDSKRLDIIWIA